MIAIMMRSIYTDVEENKERRGKQMRTCPKCTKTYTERPALSRVDSKTEICPTCGMLEAVRSIPKGAMSADQIAELEKTVREL